MNRHVRMEERATTIIRNQIVRGHDDVQSRPGANKAVCICVYSRAFRDVCRGEIKCGCSC